MLQAVRQIAIRLGACLVAHIGLGERPRAIYVRGVAEVRDSLIVIRDSLLMITEFFVELAALKKSVDIGSRLDGSGVFLHRPADVAVIAGNRSPRGVGNGKIRIQ